MIILITNSSSTIEPKLQVVNTLEDILLIRDAYDSKIIIHKPSPDDYTQISIGKYDFEIEIYNTHRE